MMSYIMRALLAASAVLALWPGVSPCASFDKDAIRELDRMREAYARVTDYTANFQKQERVDGKLLPAESIELKFKKPFKIYMKWLPGPGEGRELLYATGTNGNRLVAHGGGFTRSIVMNLDPDGKVAMRGNRHPVTDVGIGRMLDIVTGEVGKARKAGVGTITVMDSTVFGRPARLIVVEAPADGKGVFYARRSEIWQDQALRLPVKIMVYGWSGELLESYGYKDLKVNPGLSDREFERGYDGYRF